MGSDRYDEIHADPSPPVNPEAPATPADPNTAATAAAPSEPVNIPVTLTSVQWFVVLGILNSVYQDEIRPMLKACVERKIEISSLPAAQIKEIGGVTIARDRILDALVDAGVLTATESAQGREQIKLAGG